MLSGLDQSIGQAKAQKWFLQALRVPTGYDDTHPALADRLAAIGFARDSPEMMLLLDKLVEAEEKESAATYYLKELPEDFLPGLNRLWRERIVKSWRECHEQSKTSDRRLAELNEQAALQPLTIEQQWERVAILSELKDRAATVPEIKKILADDPTHVRANFALGVILLEQGNSTGAEYLEKAMELSPDVTGEACEMISGFYLEQGDKNLAEVFRSRADQAYEQEQKRREQLLNFTPKDRFEPHGLDAGLVKDIQNQLATVRGLGAAYLVRKVIEASDEPIYVLGILCDFTWQNGRNEKHPGLVMDELVAKATLLPPGVFVALDVQPAFLSYNMSQVPGAQIFALPDYGVTHRF
jgi:tetratricopeptide (TPR) repeat protein